MAPQNQAAWLDGAGKPHRVGESPYPQVDDDSVIIRNKAIAINPVDWKIQDSGMYVQKWPFVLGEDVAGEIVEVGKDVKRLRKGDRVTSHMISLLNGDVSYGGFQLYSQGKAAKTAVIPDSVSFIEGSVLPLALDTAAVGLYSSASNGYIGLDFPSHNPQPCGKTVFIWGGSSSVGALAIQLAVASGAKVVTTASRHNYELCKKWGATEVIDYKSPSVVEDVVQAIKSVGGEFAGVYDAISIEDQSLKHIFPILEKLGGGNVCTVLPPPEKVPSNVKAGHVFGINDLTHPIWENYVTKALESGELKAVPEALVIGKGLESVQKGLDENKKGVSARKVVVELD